MSIDDPILELEELSDAALIAMQRALLEIPDDPNPAGSSHAFDALRDERERRRTAEPEEFRTPPKPAITMAELAAHIPAHTAQLAVVHAFAALGAQSDWNSDTIEYVADTLKDCHTAILKVPGVPSPYTWGGSDADESTWFWSNIEAG